MRKFSACAWARVQSRLSRPAAAAELFSSCLREVGILSSLKNRFMIWSCYSFSKYGERGGGKSTWRKSGSGSAAQNAIAKWAATRPALLFQATGEIAGGLPAGLGHLARCPRRNNAAAFLA